MSILAAANVSKNSSLTCRKTPRGCSTLQPGTHHGGKVMLILSRSLGEKIIIGEEDIVLTVVAIRGHQVRLGIDAPESVPILREELAQKSPGAEATGVSS